MKKEQMITEGINPNTLRIDQMEVSDILKAMNDEDKKVAYAVEKVLPEIEKAVIIIEEALKNNGRLIYIGAGTSGRLGVLDAAECPPTYNTPPGLVLGIIAGGEPALLNALEGVEDDEEEGMNDLKNNSLRENDVVVGIAASGQTPYVIGGLKYAKSIGANTVGISCNPHSKMTVHTDVMIETVVGPEVVSGSTRLKAGTAQKMVLNMLSTASMIRLGKVYKNLMVDLQISNVKLKKRAVRIVMQSTSLNEEEAITLLQQTDWNIKEVIVMANSNIDRTKARDSLTKTKGRVSQAIEMAQNEVSL